MASATTLNNVVPGPIKTEPLNVETPLSLSTTKTFTMSFPEMLNHNNNHHHHHPSQLSSSSSSTSPLSIDSNGLHGALNVQTTPNITNHNHHHAHHNHHHQHSTTNNPYIPVYGGAGNNLASSTLVMTPPSPYGSNDMSIMSATGLEPNPPSHAWYSHAAMRPSQQHHFTEILANAQQTTIADWSANNSSMNSPFSSPTNTPLGPYNVTPYSAAQIAAYPTPAHGYRTTNSTKDLYDPRVNYPINYHNYPNAFFNTSSTAAGHHSFSPLTVGTDTSAYTSIHHHLGQTMLANNQSPDSGVAGSTDSNDLPSTHHCQTHAVYLSSDNNNHIENNHLYGTPQSAQTPSSSTTTTSNGTTNTSTAAASANGTDLEVATQTPAGQFHFGQMASFNIVNYNRHQEDEQQPPAENNDNSVQTKSTNQSERSTNGSNNQKTSNQRSKSIGYNWMNKSATISSSPSNTGKTRTKDKYRVVYNEQQRVELEKEFYLSKYITIKRKSELAGQLNLSERQVKIWFQNRRAKDRKQNRKKEEIQSKKDKENHHHHQHHHHLGVGHLGSHMGSNNGTTTSSQPSQILAEMTAIQHVTTNNGNGLLIEQHGVSPSSSPPPSSHHHHHPVAHHHHPTGSSSSFIPILLSSNHNQANVGNGVITTSSAAVSGSDILLGQHMPTIVTPTTPSSTFGVPNGLVTVAHNGHNCLMNHSGGFSTPNGSTSSQYETTSQQTTSSTGANITASSSSTITRTSTTSPVASTNGPATILTSNQTTSFDNI